MSVAAGPGATGAAPDRAPVRPDDDPRAALLEKQLKKVRYRADALIEVLHAVQDIYGFLSPEVLHTVADALELPPSRADSERRARPARPARKQSQRALEDVLHYRQLIVRIDTRMW